MYQRNTVAIVDDAARRRDRQHFDVVGVRTGGVVVVFINLEMIQVENQYAKADDDQAKRPLARDAERVSLRFIISKCHERYPVYKPPNDTERLLA